MTNRRKLILIAASSLSLAAPAPVAAQVTVDPGSPTDKEYGIPFEDERCRVSAKCDEEAPATPGERTAPIFGEGVGEDQPDDTSGATTTGGNGGNGGEGGSGQQVGGQRDSETVEDAQGRSTGLSTTRPVTATVPQSGVSDTATILAVALSVLLLGGVIGSIARRRTD